MPNVLLSKETILEKDFRNTEQIRNFYVNKLKSKQQLHSDSESEEENDEDNE